jgi:hypothetical protein
LTKSDIQFRVGSAATMTIAASSPSTAAIMASITAALVWRTTIYTASLPRRALTVEGAHQDAEIEDCDVDQIALVDILASAQPSPTRAAAIEDMGEGPLDQFAAPAHRRAPDSGSQPRSVGVDGSLRRLVAMPTQIALGRLRFGDARLPDAAFKSARD